MSQVVTRFCPSNTGWLHLGSARTALYAFAYAKKMGGKFVGRIENTDKARSTQESLIDILDGLAWLGIQFNEGPSLQEAQKGIYNPKYYQSERKAIYDEYIDKLVQTNKAYINNDGVTVFRMPQKDYVVHDQILGEVTFHADSQKDFPIRRADGSVLFHACVVLDDALMGVTDIIRANDHLSNTPKHIALYEAFGFNVPRYAHMPLILDQSGAKLSKRRDDQFVLIKDFRAAGYSPDSVVNLIGLLGWRAPDGQEEFDLNYICQNFDIKDCGKVNAKYDAKKLESISSNRIKKMNPDVWARQVAIHGIQYYPDFAARFNNLCEPDKFNDFCEVYRERSKTLKDPYELGKFFAEKPQYDDAAVDKILCQNDYLGLSLLDEMYEIFSNTKEWTKETINDAINSLANDIQIGVGKIAQAIRVAVSGSTVSPPIDMTLVLLGRRNTLERIATALAIFKPAMEL
jgi:glutamyl/glutaminyl-tRNA synthetase